MSADLLRLHLCVTVPFLIAELRNRGGPDSADLQRVVEAGELGGCFSEALLYRTKPGETAKEAARLSRAVAILAFCPGGVGVFGLSFCAEHCPAGREQESRYCAVCAEVDAGGADAVK